MAASVISDLNLKNGVNLRIKEEMTVIYSYDNEKLMNKANFSHAFPKFVLKIDIVKNKLAGKNGNGLKLKQEIANPDILLRCF